MRYRMAKSLHKVHNSRAKKGIMILVLDERVSARGVGGVCVWKRAVVVGAQKIIVARICVFTSCIT